MIRLHSLYSSRFFEHILCLPVVLGLIYSLWHLATYFYLPQPFFYDYGDTWMDWFNPAYWSHQPGTYDSYKTIYPPLTYVILKYITWGPCYVSAEGGWSRECDTLGIISLHIVYALCVVGTAATLYKSDRETALPRSLAISMGLPMMWGLDRGNAVLIAYLFVMLAYGPLIKSARLKMLFAGMSVNMKVYLIGAVFSQLAHNRWRFFEGSLISVVVVYLISLAAFGEGTPGIIINNIVSYAGDFEINNPLDLWMASSLKPLTALLNSQKFPVSLYTGSMIADLAASVLPLVTLFSQATILLGAFCALLRPDLVPRSRMLVFSIGIAVLSTEVSGYTQIMVLLFLFMERFEGVIRRYAIIVGYLVCIPADIDIDRLPPMVYESYLGGRPIFAIYLIQIGPFVRPFLTMSIPVSLAILSIWTVAAAMRRDGFPNWMMDRKKWAVG